MEVSGTTATGSRSAPRRALIKHVLPRLNCPTNQIEDVAGQPFLEFAALGRGYGADGTKRIDAVQQAFLELMIMLGWTTSRYSDCHPVSSVHLGSPKKRSKGKLLPYHTGQERESRVLVFGGLSVSRQPLG